MTTLDIFMLCSFIEVLLFVMDALLVVDLADTYEEARDARVLREVALYVLVPMVDTIM